MNENENENENESVNKDENKNENGNESESENESDDEQYYEIKQINSNFKKIDETISFKSEIDIKRNTMLKWLLVYWVLWR